MLELLFEHDLQDQEEKHHQRQDRSDAEDEFLPRTLLIPGRCGSLRRGVTRGRGDDLRWCDGRCDIQQQNQDPADGKQRRQRDNPKA